MMNEAQPSDRRNVAATRFGIACSVCLHALILLLLFVLPHPGAPRTGGRPLIPVDLVEAGAETSAPPALRQAVIPQEKAARRPDPSPIRTVPLPRQAKADQPSAHQAKAAHPDDGAGKAPLTAGTGDMQGNGARIALKDVIRAQIERRWYPQSGALLHNDWEIQLHLVLNRNGSLEKLDLLDDPRLGNDSQFRDFAYSVRNAAILSAPYSMPPSMTEEGLDFILAFNPRRVLQ